MSSICYITCSKKKIDSIKSFYRYQKEMLDEREIFILDESIVVIEIPFWVEEQSEKLQSKSRVIDFLFQSKFINQYYHKRYKKILQSKLWERLLEYQNDSFHPAFCSKTVWDNFSKDEFFQRELWLNTEIPLAIIKNTFEIFLKKACRFRKNTRVFIIDNKNIDSLELLFPYCTKINYLQILVEDYACCPCRLDQVYRESGLPISVTTKVENITDADIIMDFQIGEKVDYAMIKKNCIYFDAFANKEKERSLRKSGSGITYLSSLIYLDRALKSTL